MRGGILKRKSAHSRQQRRRLDGCVRSTKARWVKVTRTFRDGSSQDWWALELDIRPYGPDKQERVIVATTDPATLPELTTFYLITNLPAPRSPRAQDSECAAASVEEV